MTNILKLAAKENEIKAIPLLHERTIEKVIKGLYYDSEVGEHMWDFLIKKGNWLDSKNYSLIFEKITNEEGEVCCKGKFQSYFQPTECMVKIEAKERNSKKKFEKSLVFISLNSEGFRGKYFSGISITLLRHVNIISTLGVDQ